MDALATSERTTNAPARSSLVGAFVAPALVVVAVLAAWAGRGPRPLAPIGAVADFQLVDQSGRPFTRHDLDGRPWLADFIFTRCGGPCPVLSHDVMAKLQDRLERTDARLVSFTVDPEHDTPSVLADYARSKGATERWTFATGDVGALTSLCYGSFMLPMSRNDGAPVGQLVTHSSRVVLVDREGKIRGTYSPLDENLQPIPAEIDRIDHDLRALGNRSSLPLLNASLNATSALLLVIGFLLIRAGRTRAHATVMLGALAVSAVFLGFYLYYHLTHPDTPLAVEGPRRWLYFAVLIPHIILAIPVVPFAVVTAALAIKGRFEDHRRWARRTFPLWIYVSVTGVAVYALLYEIYRP